MFAPMVHMFGQYGWHKASAFVGTFASPPPSNSFHLPLPLFVVRDGWLMFGMVIAWSDLAFCVLDDFYVLKYFDFDLKNLIIRLLLPSFWLVHHPPPPLRDFFHPILSNLTRSPIILVLRQFLVGCTAPFMVSIVAYVIGLLFYAFHFPECKWPGKFDIWGSSHQVRYFIYSKMEWVVADQTFLPYHLSYPPFLWYWQRHSTSMSQLLYNLSFCSPLSPPTINNYSSGI